MGVASSGVAVSVGVEVASPGWIVSVAVGVASAGGSVSVGVTSTGGGAVGVGVASHGRTGVFAKGVVCSGVPSDVGDTPHCSLTAVAVGSSVGLGPKSSAF